MLADLGLPCFNMYMYRRQTTVQPASSYTYRLILVTANLPFLFPWFDVYFVHQIFPELPLSYQTCC